MMSDNMQRGAFRKRKTDPLQITEGDFSNPWTFHSLLLNDNNVLIDWLRRNQFLVEEYMCPKCDKVCAERKKTRCIDGRAFRCTANRNHEYSIRVNSFFSKSHYCFQDILQFLRCFVDGQSLSKCAQNAGINYKNSAVDWACYVRELCKEYVVREIFPMKFSGEIEIDESHFCRKIKHHRGEPRSLKSVWVFGMVERESNRIIMYPVDKRDASTLTEIIERHVEKGSTIYSDGWAAYTKLNELGYRHFSVIHKQSFKKKYINSDTGEETIVHTNRIEGAWKHAKSHFVSINGTNLANFEGHLCEVMYRNHVCKQQRYVSFFDLLKSIYTLEQPPQYTYSTPMFHSWSMSAPELRNSLFCKNLGEEEEVADDPLQQPDPTDTTDTVTSPSLEPFIAAAVVGSEMVCCPPTHLPANSDGDSRGSVNQSDISQSTTDQDCGPSRQSTDTRHTSGNFPVRASASYTPLVTRRRAVGGFPHLHRHVTVRRKRQVMKSGTSLRDAFGRTIAETGAILSSDDDFV